MADENHIGSAYLLGELDRMIEKTNNNGDDAGRTTFVVLKGIYCEMRSLKGEVRRNPFFIAGKYAKEYPKRSALWMAALFMVINMWFVSGWRQPVLVAIFKWLGLPEELVP